jgi:glycerol-1-phosphatase
LTGNGPVPADVGARGRGAGGAGGPADRTSPSTCPGPLSEHYDAALLDLDGVVYLGSSPIPGAADALADAAKRGMRRAYVTNNASRTPHAIAAQLRGMGVAATATDIVTSAQAAAHLLADRLPPGAPVLVVGGTGLRLAIRDRGLRPVTAAADRPAAVVQGYSHDISYGLLAEAALALEAGALYVASNIDATLPTPRGEQPGNGSLVQVLIYATGVTPIVAGKPEPPLHAESVQRVGAVRPLVVGDRLDTDIEGAVRGGADSLLVLTGVSTPADVLLAPPQRRPAYIAADLSGLNAGHPEVAAQGGAFRCGGWTAAAVNANARPAGAGAGAAGAGAAGAGAAGAGAAGGGAAGGGAAGGGAAVGDAAGGGADGPGAVGSAGGRGGEWLTVSGSGDWVDGLRALCAAAWTAGPPPGDADAQRTAAESVIAAIKPDQH